MKTKTQLTAWTIFLIFVLCLSLINVNPVLADDAPPTEPPTATEEVTEPPTEEATPIPEFITETPVSTEEPPVTEEQVPSSEEPPASELLAELPENTELVVLDENGDRVLLASQEAAVILEEADPMWCPQGILPNGVGCTTNLTITQLLTLMRTNAGGQFSTNGVIYFERSGLTTYNQAFILDDSASSLGASYNTLRAFNITLRGGWNGGATNTFHATQSSQFDNNNNAIVRTGSSGNPWIGSVTLQDIFVQDNTTSNNPSIAVYTTNGSVTLNDVDTDDIGNSTAINVVVSGTGSVSMTDVDVSNGTNGSGITVTTNSGNIFLADVDVTNQEDGYTTNLQSQSGNITITNGISNGSSFVGNNDNMGFSATTTTGSITITGASGGGNQITFNDASGPGGTNYNGAMLSAAAVTLTQVTANNNDLNGIQISNANTITLNNVISTNNGTSVTGPDIGSGLRVFGTGSTIVNINGGTFSNNERYGIEISNGTANIISAPAMTGNGEGNLLIIDNTAPTITPNINCSLPGNAGWCRGTITITWTVTETQSAVNTNGCGSTTINTNTSATGTTLTCSATSTGGTSSNSITVFRDGTNPTISAAATIPPNGNGWYNGNVTIHFTCGDGLSGIATCPADQLLTASGTSTAQTAIDQAGNTSAPSNTVSVQIDKVVPTITAAFFSGTPGNNGWYRSNVVVRFTCADIGGSGITAGACPADQTLSTESSSVSSTAQTVTDRAGNISATSNVITVKIDKTAPTVSAAATIPPNGNGWYNGNVTIHFTCGDGLSGIATCPADQLLTASGTSTAQTAIDQAGNTSAPSNTVSVQIDKVVPTITAAFFSGTPGNNGWYRSNVVVRFTCADIGGSGITAGACPADQTLSTESSSVSSTAQTVTDRAGNISATSNVITVKIDKTAPTVSAAATTLPNGAGWYNTDVTVHFTCADGLSGIATCPADQVLATSGTSSAQTATDQAGNSSAASNTVTVQIDKVAPSITLVSRTPANGNGWNNGNVTVQWSCSDALSGVVSASVSQTVTTEGANQSATATCQDLAGNTASNTETGINIDKTAPTLSLPANLFVEATGPAGANVNYSALASDNLDTSPTLNCLPASGGVYPLGTTAVTCTATDDADNTSAPSSFNIIVQDTTPPTIDPVADMTVYTFGIFGKRVTYLSPATSDIVDGSSVATCTPASDSFFVMGNNHVTCSATDAHGNTSSISFVLVVDEAELTVATSSGFFIPATGGSFIKLGCAGPDSFNVNMAGARIIFKNLCGYEAFINNLQQPELPGELTSGFEFVDGYTINISKDGKIVSPLPQNASVAIEFNIPNNQKDADLGVLYWNGTQWIETAGEKIDGSHFMFDITAEMANSNTFIFVAK